MLERTLAASCYEFNLDQAYRKARAVFVGTAASTKAVPSSSDSSVASTKATLLIQHQWKGPLQKAIDVTTCGNDQTVCVVGVDFQLGERYLVFAYGTSLETSSCDTWRISGPADDRERQEGERHVRTLDSRHRDEH